MTGAPSGFFRNSDSGQGLEEVAELRYQAVLGQPCARSLAIWAKVMPMVTLESYRARRLYEAMSELLFIVTYMRVIKM